MRNANGYLNGYMAKEAFDFEMTPENRRLIAKILTTLVGAGVGYAGTRMTGGEGASPWLGAALGGVGGYHASGPLANTRWGERLGLDDRWVALDRLRKNPNWKRDKIKELFNRAKGWEEFMKRNVKNPPAGSGDWPEPLKPKQFGD